MHFQSITRTAFSPARFPIHPAARRAVRPAASPLSRAELRRIVAEMID